MGARDCFILHILFHSVLFDLHMLNKFSSLYAFTLLRLDHLPKITHIYRFGLNVSVRV